MEDARPRRGLATARTVLHVLATSRQHPRGCAPTRSPQVVGKSASTAYYLLASLVEEGFADPRGRPLPAAPSCRRAAAGRGPPALEDAVDDLFLRTHKRCYLGVVAAARSRSRSCAAARGSRACPAWARASPTTPTRWRWARWCSRGCAARRWSATPRAGWRPSRPARSRPARSSRRARARRASDGFAVDREEFDEDFCCVAAPVVDERGELRGALGLSASARAFDAEHDELAEAVLGVAAEAALEAVGEPRFQHRAEKHEFLEGPGRTGRTVRRAPHAARASPRFHEGGSSP